MYQGKQFKSRFKSDTEWFKFYGDVKKQVPIYAPTPYGKDVEVTAWVDVDRAGDKLTRYRHTGELVLLNLDPIVW